MPRKSKRRVKKRGSTGARGGSSESVRCRSRVLGMNIYSDGTTAGCISAFGAAAPTTVAIVRPGSAYFFNEYVTRQAQCHLRYRLRSLTLEIVPVNPASTATYVLGFCNDPAATFSSGPNDAQIACLKSARVMNTGTMQHQKITYRPAMREWKYTSEDSETTAASVREVGAGELWANWSLVVPAAGRYADVLIHYDIEFRDPISNQNLTKVRDLSFVRPGTNAVTGCDREKQSGISSVVRSDGYVFVPEHKSENLVGVTNRPGGNAVNIRSATALPSVCIR